MRPLVVAAALIACTAHAGGVYKWTDERGVVHYTDRPIGPSAATQVPGMTVGTRPSDVKLSRKAMPEGVRGIWCQLDSAPPPAPPPAATAAPSVAAAIGHIEWTFRLFDFEYHELGKDFRIAGDYAVNDGKLTTNHRDVGNFEILELTAAQMKLGRDQTSLQLQRGKCAPPAPK